jgi:hypothetical protein
MAIAASPRSCRERSERCPEARNAAGKNGTFSKVDDVHSWAEPVGPAFRASRQLMFWTVMLHRYP